MAVDAAELFAGFWRDVVSLLVEAADRGYTQSATDPAFHSTALAADDLASAAVALLPPELDDELDNVVLDEDAQRLSVAGLIRAAEAATLRHPIEELAPGASGVIVALCELAAEAGT